jgi:hypothetical protein
MGREPIRLEDLRAYVDIPVGTLVPADAPVRLKREIPAAMPSHRIREVDKRDQCVHPVGLPRLGETRKGAGPSQTASAFRVKIGPGPSTASAFFTAPPLSRISGVSCRK